jgi:hypothetical protein
MFKEPEEEEGTERVPSPVRRLYTAMWSPFISLKLMVIYTACMNECPFYDMVATRGHMVNAPCLRGDNRLHLLEAVCTSPT